MEGIPGWLILGIFAVYGLAVIGLLPALAAVGNFLAGRLEQARTLFAGALLSEAVVWAAFCFLLLTISGHANAEDFLDRLPIGMGLTGLSLLLAGSGQRSWSPTLSPAPTTFNFSSGSGATRSR